MIASMWLLLEVLLPQQEISRGGNIILKAYDRIKQLYWEDSDFVIVSLNPKE